MYVRVVQLYALTGSMTVTDCFAYQILLWWRLWTESELPLLLRTEDLSGAMSYIGKRSFDSNFTRGCDGTRYSSHKDYDRAPNVTQSRTVFSMAVSDSAVSSLVTSHCQ